VRVACKPFMFCGGWGGGEGQYRPVQLVAKYYSPAGMSNKVVQICLRSRPAQLVAWILLPCRQVQLVTSTICPIVGNPCGVRTSFPLFPRWEGQPHHLTCYLPPPHPTPVVGEATLLSARRGLQEGHWVQATHSILPPASPPPTLTG
jgi:hypothetical protein